MDDNKKVDGWDALRRAKAKKQTEPKGGVTAQQLVKEQSEAERLFFLFFPEALHWQNPSILVPFNPSNYLPHFKQDALAILGTGIIGENGLKGHAGHKKFFPVDQKDLIISLIDRDYQYHSIAFYPGDILKKFDSNLDSMVALARIAGATDFQIKQAKDNLKNLRDKIFFAVSQGNFPPNWRELIKEELISSYKHYPKTQAQAFAIVFLEYVPQAKTKRIVTWVNAVLKSLERLPASEARLWKYIEKERKLRPHLRQKPSNNPL